MAIRYRRHVRQAQALASVALLFAGCGEDQPTEPDEEPSLVVRGHDAPAGCVPEVIESSSDSTETVLVTFTTTDPDGCYPNLVEWGIDMADPIGVDTPQGTGEFRIKTGTSVVDMPTPPYAAIGANYTPPQVMIEFDPPVRSVEFYYSRLAQDRAIWGGQIVETDSMRVRAMSRIPGTLSYWTWDSETLHSNVLRTTPPWDTWTYVKLSTSSDKIQWLWFDGTLVIDDLKITRMPLNCTAAVQRGHEVVCTVASPQLGVTGWRFTPDDSLPAVEEQTSAREWRGIAAAGGTVTVHVTDGVTPRDFTRHFNVIDRPSPWDSLQSYREGPELTAPDAEPGLGVTLGRNCPENLALCVPNQSRVQPSPIDSSTAGYVTQQILGGPNTGYWYVYTARYQMKRVGNLNPAVLAGSPRTHSLPGSVPKKCRRGLGFGPHDSVFANFHGYNGNCQNVDMVAFVAALFGHEGFGYDGGKGHESLAQAAASETGNDPHAAVERLVAADSAALAKSAREAVIPIAIDITQRADDFPETGPDSTIPSGNRQLGDIWFWNEALGIFDRTTINGF